jgi:uncharacterized caspase-like protein
MRIRILVAAALTALTVSFAASAASAERLVALSIGVEDYTVNNQLMSPDDDARLVADALADRGFDVWLVTDPSTREMAAAIDDFIDEARNADVAIIYFSGHGMQMNGEAYIIPADAGEASAGSFIRDDFAVDALVDRLDAAGVDFKFVIVDACRNNPYIDSGNAYIQLASVNAGEAEERPLGQNALISFASAPGQSSQDWGGSIGYSLYTAAFVQALQSADQVDIRDVLQAARLAVIQASSQPGEAIQIPWEESSLVSTLEFTVSSGGSVTEWNGGGSRPGSGPSRLEIALSGRPDAA